MPSRRSGTCPLVSPTLRRVGGSWVWKTIVERLAAVAAGGGDAGDYGVVAAAAPGHGPVVAAVAERVAASPVCDVLRDGSGTRP